MATRKGLSSRTKNSRFAQGSSALDSVEETLQGKAGPVSIDDVSVIRQLPTQTISADKKNRPLTKLDPENPETILPDDPYRDQKLNFLEGLRELAESIKSTKLHEPVIVYPHGEGYRLICGERRWLACIIADIKEIPAIVYKRKPANLRQIQAIENLQREDVLLWERIESLRDIIKENERTGGNIETAADLAGILKKGERQCRRYMQMLTAPADVLDAIKHRHINSLKIANKVADIREDDIRKKVVDRVGEGTLKSDAIEHFVAAEKKKKTGRKKKKAGRSRTQIDLGKIRDPRIVKKLFSAIMPSKTEDIDWDDLDAVQSAWNTLIDHIKKESV